MIRLRTLGDCAFELPRKEVKPTARITFATLLYLAMEHGKQFCRTDLHALIWPRISDTKAAHRFRQILYNLNLAGSVPLSVDDLHVRLPSKAISIDFQDAFAFNATDIKPLLQDFLPGYAPTISRAFDDWLQSVRERVAAHHRSSLLRHLAAQRLRGDWQLVETIARRTLAMDPLNEVATLQLVEVTAMAGNRAKAHEILEGYVAELGVEASTIAIPPAILRTRISDTTRSDQALSKGPLVGRENEFATLCAFVKQIRSANRGACVISGEAGVGKSRLAEEVSKVAKLDGISSTWVRCSPSYKHHPLLGIVELVESMKGMPGALGCSPTSMQYLKRLTGESTEFSMLNTLEDPAPQVQSSIRQAVKDLVGAVADEKPVLIVIDDVDRLDDFSTLILADLCAARDQRVVLLMVTRKSLADLGPLSSTELGLTTCVLQPLDRTQSLALLEELTAVHCTNIPSSVCRSYVELAGGNPFFLHELVHYWSQWGHRAPVPLSIQETLGRRIDSLSSGALRLLQVLTLLNEAVGYDRLGRISGLSDIPFRQHIDELASCGLIHREDGLLWLSHEVLATIAKGKLSFSESRDIHLCVAKGLRRELHEVAESRTLWQCVEQYHLAGQVAEAMDLLRECSAELLRLGLPREALAIWDRAAESYQSDTERFKIVVGLIPALRASGDLKGVASTAEEALRLRKKLRLGDRAWTEWQMDLLEARMYSLVGFTPLLAEARTCLADVATPLRIRARAGICALTCAYDLTDPASLVAVYDQLIALSDCVSFSASDNATLQLIYHSTVGDMSAAVEAGRSLVEIARRDVSLTFLAQSLRRYAKILRLLGRFTEAENALREALTLAQRIESRSYELAAINLLAEMFVERGLFAAAREWLAEQIQPIDRKTYPFRAIESGLLCATVAVLEGDYVLAQRRFDSPAIGRWRRISGREPSRGIQHALALSCMLDLQRKSIAATDPDFCRLVREFTATQGIGDRDFIAFTLAKVFLASGQGAAAQELLRQYLTVHRRECYQAPNYLTRLITPAREVEVRTYAGAKVVHSRE